MNEPGFSGEGQAMRRSHDLARTGGKGNARHTHPLARRCRKTRALAWTNGATTGCVAQRGNKKGLGLASMHDNEDVVSAASVEAVVILIIGGVYKFGARKNSVRARTKRDALTLLLPHQRRR